MPNTCPICGKVVRDRSSDLFGDFRCPGCDHELFFVKIGRQAEFFRQAYGARIRTRLVSFLSQQLCIEKDKVTPDAWLIKDYGADSLDLVQLVMELEEELDSR